MAVDTGLTPPPAPALFTDRYELTMVAAALADGTAERDCVFEVFARRLPHGRRYGVVAGTGRLLEALPHFRFGDDELAALREQGLTDARLLDWPTTGQPRWSSRWLRRMPPWVP